MFIKWHSTKIVTMPFDFFYYFVGEKEKIFLDKHLAFPSVKNLLQY